MNISILREVAATKIQAIARRNKVKKKTLNQQLLVTFKRSNISQDKKYKKIKKLLDRGADANATYKIGWTVLHEAVKIGHTDSVQLLLNQRADINAKDNFDETALGVAIKYVNLQIVKLLLDRGAEIDAIALRRAVLRGHSVIVKELVIAGANLGPWSKTDFVATYAHRLRRDFGEDYDLEIIKKAIKKGKSKLINLYKNNKDPLNPKVTKERLNDLLSKRIPQDLKETPYLKKIFDYANSKRLSKQQIYQVNKYIKERAALVIQTAYRGYREKK